MPRITGSVGEGGKNDPPDVSVIQLGLYHIEVRTSFGVRRLYQGMIDGLNSPEVKKAISTFQQCVGERVTGRIQPFTPILSRFRPAGLPISLIGMEGIKGTTAVFVPDIPPSEIETQARTEITRVEFKAPLPTKLAASLSGVIRRINMKTKLYLVLKDVCITPQGRFEARLRFELAGFVSPMTRRLILGEPDYAPPEVIGLVCEQVESAGGWIVGSYDCLIFTSTNTYASLTNRKEPTAAELKQLGLAQCPSDKILKAMVQGCINLANRGALTTAPGKAEHTDLITVATRIDASVGAKLQGASSQKSIKFMNPTGGGIRGQDSYGDGSFGASRDGGRRSHASVDYIATVGQNVVSSADGTIYKFGFPYNNDLSYRYVGIETPQGHRIRQMYVMPDASLSVGDSVSAGDVVGTYQSLQKRFPGIIEHVHLDIEKGGAFVDPTTLIP